MKFFFGIFSKRKNIKIPKPLTDNDILKIIQELPHCDNNDIQVSDKEKKFYLKCFNRAFLKVINERKITQEE